MKVLQKCQGEEVYLVTNATFSSPSICCFPYFSVWQTIPEIQSLGDCQNPFISLHISSEVTNIKVL